MKVLIAAFDLFLRTGGGQTVYRRLIETNPGIEFYYLAQSESADARRPSNAHSLSYKEVYSLVDFGRDFHDIDPPRWIYDAVVRASNLAASVAGQQFDVVELPDYEQFGAFLRPALRRHGVEFERIVLSLHGRISTTVRLNWSSEGMRHAALEIQEETQYRAVDTRYGISRSYLDEWRAIVDLEAHYLNPLQFMGLPKPVLAPVWGEPPSVNFIGRTEKRKGPDIFVELVWWLPRSSFSTANIIGPDSYDLNGRDSGFYLHQMVNDRYKDVKILPAMNQSELARLFASRAMVFLPSRYDTLNLIALESLFSGCPTAIGSGAGVCRFLRETFPHVPFVTIDVGNVYTALPAICAILENYDDYRERLVLALLKSEPNISGSDLERIYTSPPNGEPEVQAQLERWYDQLMRFRDAALRHPTRRLTAAGIKLVKSVTSPEAQRQLRALRSQLSPARLRALVRSKLIKAAISTDARVVEQALRARSLRDRYKTIFYAPEQTEQDLSRKLRMCWKLASHFRIDRARIWSEIARIERLRGNDLIAATYELRVMRSLGEDRSGHLASVVATLKAHGFGQEAQAAQAMYGPERERVERCSTLLEHALSTHTSNADQDPELIDDRRESSAYRVSVIVSLYNAAAKLPFFLRALQNQTLIRARVAEVILVETGSPGDDYGAFQQSMSALDIPVVYARTAQRETIQSAWNRGIALARAPYLAFLGVDEMIIPDCLEVLAAELDTDPALDWVQGNSVVTQVDQHGSWLYDIMVYDRTGYRQDLAYVETCYLSWVGALYRRSIHERFGNYDATFGAAGDTEFKNRVLPFIKTKFIPRTLGIFRNYPEERTTQSPRAEIEDLRAWYLHRTLAGVKYAFSRRDPSEVETLLYDSLRYRKSYCSHWSTDVEYAANLAAFLQEKAPSSPALKYADGIKQVLIAYRFLEWLPKLSPLAAMVAPLRVRRLVSRVKQQQRALGNPVVQPLYQIFNDNRYEQHSYLWESDI